MIIGEHPVRKTTLSQIVPQNRKEPEKEKKIKSKRRDERQALVLAFSQTLVGYRKRSSMRWGCSFRPSRNVVLFVLLPEDRINASSINRHSRGHCSHGMCSSQGSMPSFIRVALVLDANNSSSLDVRLQAFVEVGRTPCAIYDGENQQ